MDEQQQQTSQKTAPLLDHEDWLYVAAIVCMGAGASLFHVGAGLICVSLLLLGWPLMARLCSAGKGPPK